MPISENTIVWNNCLVFPLQLFPQYEISGLNEMWYNTCWLNNRMVEINLSLTCGYCLFQSYTNIYCRRYLNIWWMSELTYSVNANWPDRSLNKASLAFSRLYRWIPAKNSFPSKSNLKTHLMHIRVKLNSKSDHSVRKDVVFM